MAKRAGTTRKISLSVDEGDYVLIKNRAQRLHEGNVSAVFAEMIALMKREEGWAKMVAWYGKPIEMTPEERDEIDAELLGRPVRKTRRKGRAA